MVEKISFYHSQHSNAMRPERRGMGVVAGSGLLACPLEFKQVTSYATLPWNAIGCRTTGLMDSASVAVDNMDSLIDARETPAWKAKLNRLNELNPGKTTAQKTQVGDN